MLVSRRDFFRSSLKFCAIAAANRAAVSMIFATAVIPLLMLAGIAIDYGFYNEARAQLNMAADAAAIHGVRVAAQGAQSYQSDYIAQGNTAGSQWFSAQLGTLTQGNVAAPVVNTIYNAATSTFSTTVSYSGNIRTHFGGLFHLGSWPISSTAVAVITTGDYVEVQMLLDNSSSMMIAADNASIVALETATMCSTQGATMGQPMDYTYTWNYPQGPNLSDAVAQPTPLPYGYGTFQYNSKTLGASAVVNKAVPVRPQPANSMCDPRFTGNANQCFYPQAAKFNLTAAGECKFGGGSGHLNSVHSPQAPCAFACHNSPANTDYYGLARNTPGVTLRFDVVRSAASHVIQTMASYSNSLPIQNQLSVGVETFNAPGADSPLGFAQIYPVVGEAGPITPSSGLDPTSAVTAMQPPVTGDQPDTDFYNAMTQMGLKMTKAGDGTTPAGPQKNLFIVTDGLNDFYDSTGARQQGPINFNACNQMKKLGVTIFVLYTNYLPLPNYYYLNNDLSSVEGPGIVPPTPISTGFPAAPQSTISQALQACASKPTKTHYYEASNPTDIDAALQTMLSTALNVPGRVSQ